MTFKNKYFRLMYTFFASYGIAVFVLLPFIPLVGERLKVLLPVLAINLIFPNLLNMFLFSRREPDVKKLWYKRIYYMIGAVTWATLIFVLFRYFNNIYQVLLGLGVMILCNLLVSVPLFIFADRYERKNIEAINKKLQENEFE